METIGDGGCSYEIALAYLADQEWVKVQELWSRVDSIISSAHF